MKTKINLTILALLIVFSATAQTPRLYSEYFRFKVNPTTTIGGVPDSANYATQALWWYGVNGYRFSENGVKYSLGSYINTFGNFWKLNGTSTATGNMLINAGTNTFELRGDQAATNMRSAFYSATDSSGFFAYNPLVSNYRASFKVQNNNIQIVSAESGIGGVISQGNLSVGSNNVSIGSGDGTTATAIEVTTAGATVYGDDATFQGLTYGGNYRGNYTGLTMVDRDYVIATTKTYSARQTFAGTATVAGANFARAGAFSASLADGDLGYRTDSDLWLGRTNGTILPFTQGPTTSTAFGIPYYTGTTGSLFSSTGVGTAGHVLTSNGAGVAPTFQATGATGWAVTGTTTLTGNADIDADGNNVTIGTTNGPQLGVMSDQVYLTKGDPNGYGFTLGTTDQAFVTGAEVYIQADGGNESISMDVVNGVSISSPTKVALGGSVVISNAPVHDDTVQHILTWDYDDQTVKVLHKSDLGGIGGTIANGSGFYKQIAISNGTDAVQGTDKFAFNNSSNILNIEHPSSSVALSLGPSLVQFFESGGQTNMTKNGIQKSEPGDYTVEATNGNTVVESVTFNSTGVAANSTGIKHKRQSVTIFPAAETEQTITWTTAFSNANYTPTVSILEDNGGGDVDGMVSIVIIEQLAASITVRIKYDGATGFDAFINAIAIHD